MEPGREQSPLGVWITTVYDAIAAVLGVIEAATEDAAKQESVLSAAWDLLIAQPVEVQEAVRTEYWDATIKTLLSLYLRTGSAIVRQRERAEAPATLEARARFYRDGLH